MKPKVSIIVPIYMSEEYLEICLNSILSQTYIDFELILVDDGSPDKSGEICDEYAIKDNRVKVIHIPNGGVSSARNAGIDEARGDYILFIDSDDWIEIYTLETLIENVEKHKSDVVIFGLTKDLIANNELIKSEYNGFYKKENISIDKLSSNFIYYLNSVGMHPSWMFLFSSNIITENKISFNKELVLFEDFDFNLRYLKLCKRITFIPNTLYHYNISVTVNQLEKRKKQNIVFDISTVCNSLFDFLEKTGAEERVIQQAYSYILPMYSLCLKNILVHRRNTKLKEKIKILKELYEDKLYLKMISKHGNSLRFYRILSSFTKRKHFFLAYSFLRLRFNK